MGAAAGVTLAVALLVFSCVFAAMAGPAVSLRLRTEALHQALNRAGPLGTSIEVDASWNTFTAAFTGQQVLTEDDLSGATSTLARGVAASVPLAGGSWSGLTTRVHAVLSGTGRMPIGYHPALEVTYRDQLSSNVQVIAGRIADAAIPPGVLGVTVTQPTAARYSLRPGSRLKLGSHHGPIDLLVTAIVRARNPASTFWATDPLVTRPDVTENLVSDQFTVLAGALADPGQVAAVQSAFCPAVSSGCDFMRLEWEFPVAVLTLARLTVMGYERDNRLVLLMALPAVLAAFAAAAGCALALPVLVGPALDLSVFTGTGVPVEFRPDLAALGLPCVAILLLMAVALITETSRSRRHGVTGLLRVQ